MLQLWIASEVHQQPKLHLPCMEIFQQLSPVSVGECRHSLELDNNLLKTNEARFVPLSQNLATVSHLRSFCDKNDIF